jgi:hypothetical protein
MRLLSEHSEGLDRSAATSWLRAKLHLAETEPSMEAAPAEPISWQEVHRRDTSWLAQRHMLQRGIWAKGRTEPTMSEPMIGTSELSWMRRNSALVYLLRTGQWQPVPSSLPDRWVERLAANFSGITVAAARRILLTALKAVPQLDEAVSIEPLTAGEREWAKQNSTTLRDLHSGVLRGMPKGLSRNWVAAFQSAVGGTAAEVTAMLAIIVNVADNADTTTVTAK